MKRVTTEDYIRIVGERMAQGQSYEQASNNLITDGEQERKRDRDGQHYEVLISDLRTPATDYNDDGDEIGGTGGMSSVEWGEQEAALNGRYDAIGWTPPPGDPLDKLLAGHEYDELHAAIAGMSKLDQTIIDLLFWKGKTQMQVAEALGVNQATISRALSATKERLRLALPAEMSPPNARPKYDDWKSARNATFKDKIRALDMRNARIREAAEAEANGREWTLTGSNVSSLYRKG
jgi:RNA polymerase sigma factor (sigma-70 family)